MPILQRDDVGLYYERQGEGPTLLLLAGLFEDSSTWDTVRERLARQYDVVVFDHRCTGQSVCEPCVSGRRLMVDDCLALIDHLELQAVHMAGHALGGAIGLHLAARAPERIASLVMAAGGATVTRGHIALFDDLAALYCSDTMSRHGWYSLYFQWLHAPAFLRDSAGLEEEIARAEAYRHRHSRVALQAQVKALADFQLPPDLASIGIPVLALTGADDLLFPPADVTAALRPLPRLQEAMLPDAAHLLHREHPEAFVEAVVGFHDGLVPHLDDQVGRMSPAAGVAE